MTETARIKSLFEKLFDGHPWIDVSILPALRKLKAQQAAARPFPGCNTVWEIVNHMISWRMNVLRRVNGEVIQTPDNNYVAAVHDQSDDAWAATLQKFDHAQQQWLEFLDGFHEANFESKYPKNGMTYYEHIHGIIQHDAYHLGQIVLLSKFV